MHQANQNLIVRVAEAVGVAAERFYSNIHKYGNTSSASMLIAAAEWTRCGTWFPQERTGRICRLRRGFPLGRTAGPRRLIAQHLL